MLEHLRSHLWSTINSNCMPTAAESILQYLKTPRSVQALSSDTSLRNFPRRIANAVFASVPLQPLSAPLRVIAISVSALQLLVPYHLTQIEPDPDLVDVLAGRKASPSNPSPVAHCYWGTQFGSYAGQLGDGAAILIGEGHNGFELNLKGSGKTPFSRGFDGRKVVRSSIREFLCSEAMAGLGIPTTRAGSVILSEASTVSRDVNYSGRPIDENCAVVSRIAKTFLRFGSFESDQTEDSAIIKQLLEYSWRNLIQPIAASPTESFMDVVVDRTAYLVAQWQAVGFTHGVMNTDNMSIIGDTIDYGPFGFVESFDPHFVPNTSDKFGRYAFSQQAVIGAWNCKRLAEVVEMHLSGDTDDVTEKYGWKSSDRIESEFMTKFKTYYDDRMRVKLGLSDASDTEYNRLKAELFELLEFSAVDYTVTLRSLTELETGNVDSVLSEIMSTFPPAERVVRLSSVGLKISKADLPEIEEFAQTRLPELERVGISLNSIAQWKNKLDRIDRFSGEYNQLRDRAKTRWRAWLVQLAPLLTDEGRGWMKTVNPVYIPRQSLIQAAIEKAENQRDFTEVEKLLRLFLSPYVVDPSLPNPEWYAKPDLTDLGVCLSCSS